MFGSKRNTVATKLNVALEEVLLKTPLVIEDTEWNSCSSKEIMKFSMPENKENHTQVPYEILGKVNDVDMLYIYVCVARWANKNEGFFKCPYTRWADLLQCSDRTAKSKIKEAVSSKVIFVNRGNYIEGSSKKQDINEYTINPITYEDKTMASIAYEKAQRNKYYEGILGNNKTPLAHRKGFLEYAKQVEEAINAFENREKDLFPNDDHYYALAIVKRRKKQHLLAEEELKLLDVAQRRIKILSTNTKLKVIVDDKIEKAKRKVSQISKTDILFITYQDKIKNGKPMTVTSLSGFEQSLSEEADPFGDD